MSTLAEHSYFSPNAFEGLRHVGQQIVYDEEALGGIAALIKNELNMDLPGPVDELQLVYRACTGGVGAPKADGAFYKAGWSNLYTPASELAKPVEVPQSQLLKKSKGAIAATGRPVMEVQVQDPQQPLALAFARTLSYPAAEDAGFLVSLSAWKRFGQEVLDPTRERTRAKIQEKVTRDFIGAITLQPR